MPSVRESAILAGASGYCGEDFFRLAGMRIGRTQCQKLAERFFRLGSVVVAILRHPIMVEYEGLFGETIDGFCQQAHRFRVHLLVVINPPQRIRNMRVAGQGLPCRFGIGQRSVLVTPSFDQNPGQVIRCRSEFGVQPNRLLVSCCRTRKFFSLLMEHAEDHQGRQVLWALGQDRFEFSDRAVYLSLSGMG